MVKCRAKILFCFDKKQFNAVDFVKSLFPVVLQRCRNFLIFFNILISCNSNAIESRAPILKINKYLISQKQKLSKNRIV